MHRAVPRDKYLPQAGSGFMHVRRVVRKPISDCACSICSSKSNHAGQHPIICGENTCSTSSTSIAKAVWGYLLVPNGVLFAGLELQTHCLSPAPSFFDTSTCPSRSISGDNDLRGCRPVPMASMEMLICMALVSELGFIFNGMGLFWLLG